MLPVQASSLGLSRPTVGVILSINRWVRLGTNPLAARLYERFPAGALIVAAILLTGVSTTTYALPAAIVLFLGGRALWGLCWSLLRLGSFLAALDDASVHAGRRIGNTRAIWGIGYFAGAVYAPFAVEGWGWSTACVVAAGLSVALGLGPALVASDWRREVRIVEGHVPASVWQPRFLMLFVAATIQLSLFAGIVVAAGGFRIDELFHEGAPIAGALVPATFIAAAFALTQRIANVAWTPIAGRWSDRSASLAFGLSTVGATLAIVALVMDIPPAAFVALGGLAFTSGLSATIAVELAVARRSAVADRPRVLAALHTWQDAGAAAGALAGGVLATLGASTALLAGAGLLALTVPLWWAAEAQK